MDAIKRILSSRWGIILTGLVIGIVAPILVFYGNPKNMGLCAVCFTRDIAGALGLHRAVQVQYLRPEIIGLVLGSLLAAMVFREFRARGGTNGLVRLLLGALAAIGALMFLGCPWRALLRLAGGDGNAIAGLVGFAAGIGIGVIFLKRGFSLARQRASSSALGYVLPIAMLGLLALAIFNPQFGPPNKEGVASGPVFSSANGPGSNHVNLWLGLGAGLVIGILAQRSRFCTVGAVRAAMIMRDFDLLFGVIALIVAAFATNLILKQFNAGFDGQPIAHTDFVWNFGGMVLSGLAFVLGGGCPGRQLILAGEGDGDAGLFFLGVLLGTAFAHNFNLASSATGPTQPGQIAVIAGLIICGALGYLMKDAAPEASANEHGPVLVQATAEKTRS